MKATDGKGQHEGKQKGGQRLQGSSNGTQRHTEGRERMVVSTGDKQLQLTPSTEQGNEDPSNTHTHPTHTHTQHTHTHTHTHTSQAHATQKGKHTKQTHAARQTWYNRHTTNKHNQPTKRKKNTQAHRHMHIDTGRTLSACAHSVG